MKEITDEQARRYSRDIIAFLEDQYVLPETRKPIVLEDWQKDWILKPLFYDLDDNGRRKYSIAVIGVPKKNGKSALAAGIGVGELYVGKPYAEVIVAANARDQASMIIYNKMRQSIAINPTLKLGTLPHKELIEIKSTGSIARCVAHQYETAAGLNPSLTIFDELWGFADRKFYDELTVVPTRPDPLIFIVTYAGYEERGLLWDLYCDGMAGEPILDTGLPDVFVRRGKKDTRMFMLWSHRNLASWVTNDYIERQRRRMPPDVFARFHENRWVAAGSQFIHDDDIEAMHERPWLMQTTPQMDRLLNYIVATDLGLAHDRTARAVGHFEPLDGKIYIDSIRVWEGSPDEHVNIKEVEEDLVECAHTFKARKLVVDPWQMEYTIQRLKGIYNVVAFNPSADMQHLSQIFVNMLRSHRIVCYNEPRFERELKDAVIKQTVQGWRLDHTGRRRNDITIAVGMMMVEAVKEEYGMVAVPDVGEFATPPAGFRGIRSAVF